MVQSCTENTTYCTKMNRLQYEQDRTNEVVHGHTSQVAIHTTSVSNRDAENDMSRTVSRSHPLGMSLDREDKSNDCLETLTKIIRTDANKVGQGSSNKANNTKEEDGLAPMIGTNFLTRHVGKKDFHVQCSEQDEGNVRTVSDFSTGCIDSATLSGKASSQMNSEEQNSEEHIRHWEEEALAHYKKSAWEDVIYACEKVLEFPGQSTTNFDVLYEAGYAHMRLEEYESAYTYFMNAHKINSKRIHLRMAIADLRRKARMGPCRKRSRRVMTNEQPGAIKRTHVSKP